MRKQYTICIQDFEGSHKSTRNSSTDCFISLGFMLVTRKRGGYVTIYEHDVLRGEPDYTYLNNLPKESKIFEFRIEGYIGRLYNDA